MESPLYHARRQAGMTQQEAADAWNRSWPDDPKTAKTLSYWETGARQPSVASLRRLAEVYGCGVGDLVDGPTGVVPEQTAAPLEVAIAIVTHEADVLLVQRADDLGWQFPAGTVKPGRSAERVAVREVLAETGVHCAVRSELGSRVHPRTRALCRYFAAAFLAGDAVNADTSENNAVLWVSVVRLSEFIAPDTIHQPVLDHLGAARV